MVLCIFINQIHNVSVATMSMCVEDLLFFFLPFLIIIIRCYEGNHELGKAMNAFPAGHVSFEITFRPKFLDLNLPEEGMAVVDYLSQKKGSEKAKMYLEQRPKDMAAMVCCMHLVCWQNDHITLNMHIGYCQCFSFCFSFYFS